MKRDSGTSIGSRPSVAKREGVCEFAGRKRMSNGSYFADMPSLGQIFAKDNRCRGCGMDFSIYLPKLGAFRDIGEA